MLTTLGIIAVLFAVAMMFIYPSLRKEDSEADRFGNYTPKSPSYLLMWNGKMRLLLAGVGLALILISQSIFIARESKQYYILNKANGNRSAVMTPGLHFITPFCNRS